MLTFVVSQHNFLCKSQHCCIPCGEKEDWRDTAGHRNKRFCLLCHYHPFTLGLGSKCVYWTSWFFKHFTSLKPEIVKLGWVLSCSAHLPPVPHTSPKKPQTPPNTNHTLLRIFHGLDKIPHSLQIRRYYVGCRWGDSVMVAVCSECEGLWTLWTPPGQHLINLVRNARAGVRGGSL